jgi:hypothetical protein
MARPPRQREENERYWVRACRACFHPGGLHVIDDGCRYCQCPGWKEGGKRHWSDRETYDLAGTHDWHEQPVAPWAERTPLPEAARGSVA